MEHRFTVKDFFLFSFLALLLIMIVLAMYMVDRQWAMMAQMQRTMSEQAASLRDVRDLMRTFEAGLRSASVGASAAPVGGQTIPDAFERAYSATQRADYASGDWLVSPFGTGLKTITPLISSDAYASEVQTYVLESLLTRNAETLEWEGMLASGWEISEDGLTISFRMREGLTFSDGHPLTAEDVAFSFDFIMSERIAAPRQRAYFQKIEEVEATGKYDVVFRFKEPYFESLALAGGMAILPKHFYARYLEKPLKFNQSKGLLMGSGPYRLDDAEGWTPDAGLVELERNPYYWGPVQPPFDTLLWKVIENDSARLTTFRNGDIDLYGARPREYQQLLADKSLVRRAHHLDYMSPTAGYSYIGWNQERGGKPTLFADRRVRQAMTYLTDRRRIAEQIMLGYAEVAVSPFSPRSPQHDDDLEPHEYNLTKAKELLADAGYEDRDGDGVLESAEGRPFRFELVYFQDNSDTERIALFLRDLYAQAGILMTPKPTEWSVMIDLLEHKDFDAITLGWTSGIEIDIFQMFHSSQTVPGGDNFINYKNPQLDKVIEEARSTIDEDARMPLWQKAERILYEDQPYTFLMRSKSLIFIDDRIRNVQITKLGLNKDILPVEWFVPASLQRYTN